MYELVESQLVPVVVVVTARRLVFALTPASSVRALGVCVCVRARVVNNLLDSRDDVKRIYVHQATII